MTVPSIHQAEIIMAEAHALNPGPWAAHSRYVAQGAKAIAAHLPEIDAETAYVLGYLHDIGRRVGITGMRHSVDGYNYLLSLGYEEAAKVCLTHSFPIKNAAAGAGCWDGTEEEFGFVQAYLDHNDYTPYDRLIQLCDSLALPNGFCLMEKRLVDVVMRYGFNELTLLKWKAYFEIKDQFDRAIGKSIYCLLPGVVENSFGFHSPD